MGNLFLSFTIAISGAIALVALSRVLDLESYTNKILPLIPILYAIIYEVLEHRKKSKTKYVQEPRGKDELKDRRTPPGERPGDGNDGVGHGNRWSPGGGPTCPRRRLPPSRAALNR